jgi:hypothetical protein
MEENFPIWQSRHPSSVLYVPAAHTLFESTLSNKSVHILLPMLEVLPFGHVLHDVLPIVSAYFLMGHLRQSKRYEKIIVKKKIYILCQL